MTVVVLLEQLIEIYLTDEHKTSCLLYFIQFRTARWILSVARSILFVYSQHFQAAV